MGELRLNWYVMAKLCCGLHYRHILHRLVVVTLMCILTLSGKHVGGHILALGRILALGCILEMAHILLRELRLGCYELSRMNEGRVVYGLGLCIPLCWM